MKPTDRFCSLGKTTTKDGTKELELSFDNLQRDFLAMIRQIFPDPTESPDLVVSSRVCHSIERAEQIVYHLNLAARSFHGSFPHHLFGPYPAEARLQSSRRHRFGRR